MRGEGLAVWLLALGQTLTYAALYYSFAALLPDLETATGWSKAQLAAGPTFAFLITAVLTPFTGRLVDHGRGGEMLVGLPLIGAAGLVALAFAPGPGGWFWLWGLIGLAQAGSLYETCFAFLTRRLGEGARAAITRVTLVAGLASTLAFPLGDLFGRVFGGRGALIAFALIVVAGAVPANLWGVRILRRMERAGGARPAPEPGALQAALRHPAFWLVAAIFGAIWLNHAILITYALTLFADRGAAPGLAVLAASCIGPSQVAGRLLLMLNETRVGNRAATLLSLGAIGVASGLLWLAGFAPLLIFGFALTQGAGAGLLSILRPVLLAQTLGRRGFGAISGAVAVAPILATAAGPSVGAALLETGGPGAVYACCLGLAALGLGLGWVLVRRPLG
ncbi:Predicted arabinose efflux permease, MFS family [Gemmobacter aquatilis]|uniref:Predicted arabinose efflux permease, MFS family n=1 Tax=Gemmobacter aquatilis TaxID=933059 RepID=A0A1H7ZIP4_9RHOB|nr:MFS transporter [Gemmobacter aquatilis]SEM58143.1 Predicted arabinose efflux permease, MFS family [Gemmobacter aquatilis]